MDLRMASAEPSLNFSLFATEMDLYKNLSYLMTIGKCHSTGATVHAMKSTATKTLPEGQLLSLASQPLSIRPFSPCLLSQPQLPDMGILMSSRLQFYHHLILRLWVTVSEATQQEGAGFQA